MLGWVQVDELMVEIPEDSEDSAEAAAAVVKEILEADPRVLVLRTLQPTGQISRDFVSA